MSERATSITFDTSCPRCGRAMRFELPEGIEPADAQLIVALCLCDACAGRGSEAPAERPVREHLRSPMADP